MAVAGDVGLKIEKLTGENYHNWKFQLKMYLIGKDLWEIVTGTEVLGEGSSTQEQRSFKKMENQALACVFVRGNTPSNLRAISKIFEGSMGYSCKSFQRKSLSKKLFIDESCILHE